MQIKFLKQIVEDVAGEPAVKIVDLLSAKKIMNEFVIAKKLGLTINQTRNLLYRLSHLGILSSTRKKDRRKGWYIYFWTLNILKSLEILEGNIKKEVSHLNAELADKKSKRFYKCKLCGAEVTEESALLHDFVCPECGEVYGLSDTLPHMRLVTKRIAKLKKELEFIRFELGKEQVKHEKKIGRQVMKEVKEKQERMKRKASARKAAETRQKSKQRKKIAGRIRKKPKKGAKEVKKEKKKGKKRRK